MRTIRVLLIIVLGLALQWSTWSASKASDASGTWTPVASMSTTRADLAAATGLDGRIYAMGGFELSAYNAGSAEVYDPRTNTWSAIASTPGGAHGGAHIGYGAATGTDGRIYLIGDRGLFFNTPLAPESEVYDPHSNTWNTFAPMLTARGQLGVTAGPDGRIYAVGGVGGAPGSAASAAIPLSTVEAYDPHANAWTALAPMPTARSGLAAVTGSDGRIYVMGGYSSLSAAAAPLPTLEIYNPASNAWAAAAPMPIPLGLLAAAVGSDGRIYAMGGYSSGAANVAPVNTVEAYDPRSNTWNVAASMPTARALLAAAGGSDGRIYAIGGTHIEGVGLSTVEAFTPPVPTPTPTVILPSPTPVPTVHFTISRVPRAASCHRVLTLTLLSTAGARVVWAVQDGRSHHTHHATIGSRGQARLRMRFSCAHPGHKIRLTIKVTAGGQSVTKNFSIKITR